MLVKKEVIRKRMEAQLERIKQRRLDHANSFPEFKEKYIKHLLDQAETLKPMQNWEDWRRIPYIQPPHEPYYDGFDLDDRERRVKKNIEILDAIEGKTIEVEPVKTGRGLNLQTMFDDVI